MRWASLSEAVFHGHAAVDAHNFAAHYRWLAGSVGSGFSAVQCPAREWCWSLAASSTGTFVFSMRGKLIAMSEWLVLTVTGSRAYVQASMGARGIIGVIVERCSLEASIASRW